MRRTPKEISAPCSTQCLQCSWVRIAGVFTSGGKLSLKNRIFISRSLSLVVDQIRRKEPWLASKCRTRAHYHILQGEAPQTPISKRKFSEYFNTIRNLPTISTTELPNMNYQPRFVLDRVRRKNDIYMRLWRCVGLISGRRFCSIMQA